MALIVEDGTGLVDADSYISLADARAYALNYGYVLPTDDVEAEIALRKAANYVNLFESSFSGERLNDTQSLSWARNYAYKCYGDNQTEIPSDSVPIEIKNAQVIAADTFGKSVDVRANDDGSSIASEEVVGAVKVSYHDNGKTGNSIEITAAIDAMNSLLCMGNGLTMRTQRGYMAQDKNGLLALVATNKPDNDSEFITPAKSREVDEQIINSMANLHELTEQEFLGPVKIDNLLGQDYLEVVRSSASYKQAGGALDTIQPITFDTVDRVSADGTITVFADGTISSTVTRAIMFKTSDTGRRTSSSGNVEAFFHVEFSTDAGTTWLPAGGSFNRRISNPNSVSVVFDFSPFIIQAGVLYRSTWAQSSAGGDPASPTSGVADAELIYSEPSAALLALGMLASPSASVIIYAKG